MLFARIKIALPGQDDHRQRLGRPAHGQRRPAERRLGGDGVPVQPMATAARPSDRLDRRGKVQLLQYNPIYDPELSEFGPKLPVSQDRDKMFGLATYLLAHGRFTLLRLRPAPLRERDPALVPGHALRPGRAAGAVFPVRGNGPGRRRQRGTCWPTADSRKPTPRASRRAGRCRAAGTRPRREASGRASARIRSSSRQINNINRLFVRLKPHTSYTLIAWVKTENVVG